MGWGQGRNKQQAPLLTTTVPDGLRPLRGQDGQHTLSDSSPSAQVRFPYNLRLTHGAQDLLKTQKSSTLSQALGFSQDTKQ